MQEDNKRAKELFEQFVAVRPEVSDAYYELSSYTSTIKVYLRRRVRHESS